MAGGRRGQVGHEAEKEKSGRTQARAAKFWRDELAATISSGFRSIQAGSPKEHLTDWGQLAKTWAFCPKTGHSNISNNTDTWASILKTPGEHWIRANTG